MVAPGSSVGAKRRVLVVDDDEMLLESLGELLSSAGYEVSMAASPEEALRRVSEEEFDMLLTDLKMPGPGGLGLIDQARSSRPDLRAILMTAFGNDFIEVESVRRRGVGYIQKPFEADEMTGLVERILSLPRE